MKAGFVVALFTTTLAAENFWGSSSNPSYNSYSAPKQQTGYQQGSYSNSYNTGYSAPKQMSYQAPQQQYGQSSYQQAPQQRYQAPQQHHQQQHTDGAAFYDTLD